METTKKAIEQLKSKGVKFEVGLGNRLELAKKDAKGVPQSTGAHQVRLIRDEFRKDIRVFTGKESYKEVQGIRYWFDEAGEEKFYDVPLFDKEGKPHYLLTRFENIAEGEELELEFRKEGQRGFIEVKKAGQTIEADNESDTGDFGGVAGFPLE